MRKPILGTTLALSLSLASHQAQSQELEIAQLSESDFFSDFPVVLTATRLKQPQKNSPIATTIIDREMIEASGFTEIPDLLRLAPGMLVNYDSGHVLAAGYQFLFHRYTVRMQILVDGRSVYTPTFGEVPWTQLGITIEDIDRIEVIRGPSSSSYGPNAMTGVISIITRHASRDKGAKAKVNIGHNGLRESYLTVGENKSAFDYKITVANRKNDGFETRYDGKDVSILNFRGDYQYSNKDEITVNLNVNSSTLQEDNAIADPAEHPEHIKKVLNRSQHVKWTHTLNNNDSFSLSYYQQEYHDRNRYDAFLVIPFDRDESVKTNRQNLEFSHSIYSSNHDFSWGIILRRDKTTAPQYLYQASVDTIDTEQLFINTEHRLSERNTVNLGLLSDNNDAAGTTLSSRVSLNHHFSDEHTLRLSYAKSFRNPFIFEEYTNYYIPDLAPILQGIYGTDTIWTDQEDLEPEEIESYDVGLISYFNNKHTELDLRLFRTNLSNLIVLNEDIGGWFTNGEAFHLKGIETSLKHQFDDTSLIMNYAYLQPETDKVIYSDIEDYETGLPRHSGSLLLTHKFSSSVSGSLGYYYTGEMHQLCCSGDTQAQRRRIDMKLSKELRIDSSDAKISLILQNITNEQIETRLRNNIDRNGYISFSMDL
ncbi:MAG: TonB-dependent receptor [Gammaproteobacteria bacterium]